MAGNVKLLTSAGGGIILDTATTTATDVTVKVPAVNGDVVLTNVAGTVALAATGANIITASTNGSERMRIDSSGNLLVGTTDIAQAGQIHKLRVVSSSGSTLGINGYGSGIGFGITMVPASNTATPVLFTNASSGTVGSIDTTSTTTSYVTSSDYRLKENIQPMQNALAVVQQLNPVTYTWKADGSDGQGFIAHELQAVVPDCVTGEKDAVDEEGKPVYQGVDTSFLVATLTKAIQELSAKNDALEARIAALEAK